MSIEKEKFCIFNNFFLIDILLQCVSQNKAEQTFLQLLIINYELVQKFGSGFHTVCLCK